MNLLFKSISAVALSFSAMAALASPPPYLITNNNTNEESNAYVDNVPSVYPTPANTSRKTFWNLVKLACYGHTIDGKCPALIKMATDTANPIEVGTVLLDLDTGDITPKQLSNQGYTIIINGPGEATISKD